MIREKIQYLLFVFADSPELLPMLPTRTGNNNRIPNSNIEASPEYPINTRNGMRNLIRLPRPIPPSDINENTLVELPRKHLQRRPRHLCRDLVNPTELQRARGAGDVIRRYRWVVRDLLGEEYHPRRAPIQVEAGHLVSHVGLGRLGGRRRGRGAFPWL